jgi:hypothetical protein
MRREQVIEVLRGALLPLPHVNAAWLGAPIELSFVADLDDLAAKLPGAERLLGDLLAELG